VANRLGSNKIQWSLTYKNLLMLCWLTHDVLQSIIIPGRLVWWWCQVLIHVPYENNGVACCQIGNLLLHPSNKRCNYGMRASQTDSSLIKFIVNSINIYVYK
jgi:hypothetical protein